MRMSLIALGLAFAAALAVGAPVAAVETPLLSRELLFGNPERAAVTISPDGARLAWLAPVDGVMNVWVAPAGDLAAGKPVTKDTSRGIRIYFWAFDKTLNFFHEYSDPAQSTWVALHECTHLLTYLIEQQYYEREVLDKYSRPFIKGLFDRAYAQINFVIKCF